MLTSLGSDVCYSAPGLAWIEFESNYATFLLFFAAFA